MGFQVDRMECYFCIDCSMIYIYRENTTLAAYGFIVKHRNLEYRMIFRFQEDGSKFFRVFVNEFSSKNNYDQSRSYILDIDFHPDNITPQNAKSKLETYLAFL